jgi:hypothetical protein
MYYLKASYRVVKTKGEWVKDTQYSFVMIGNGEHILWVTTVILCFYGEMVIYTAQ